uniref:Uncharacterized protein n=1 Tax=Kalanchoe fedtschenkoi TaxID=63787 RepID=A0A7N0ZT25_KALFE
MTVPRWRSRSRDSYCSLSLLPGVSFRFLDRTSLSLQPVMTLGLYTCGRFLLPEIFFCHCLHVNWSFWRREPKKNDISS